MGVEMLLFKSDIIKFKHIMMETAYSDNVSYLHAIYI